MKLSTTLAAISQLALGTASVIQNKPPYEIRSIYTPTWDVEVHPGKPTVALNGTAEQVFKQVLELNPNYRTDYADYIANQTSLTKRTDFYGRKYFCGKWPCAGRRSLQEGFSYLRSLKGQPRNGPGPGACGRVSCSYHSGILWCNDDPHPKTLNSWQSIVDGAEYLFNACYGPFKDCVGGQVFHESNWNVILRYEEVSC